MSRASYSGSRLTKGEAGVLRPPSVTRVCDDWPMPSVEVNEANVREFEDADAFYDWLRDNHAKRDEVWIKVHKVRSGLKSITPKEAIDVVLCWGWIDAIRKRFDDRSYLQRYVPRRPTSTWSKVNVENVARLIEEGRMTEHGIAQVEAAKADGRWARAYGGSKDLKLPEAMVAAIAADPEAQRTYDRLTAQNRFAIAFRLHHLKTEAARQRRMRTFLEMLKRGETIYPQGSSR